MRIVGYDLQNGWTLLRQLVFHCHVHGPPPSPHEVHSICMHLLPLVEMYCWWELGEECNDHRHLMLQFDSELELESHELGRSVLYMVKDDETGKETLSRHIDLNAVHDPFVAIRERLAMVDLNFGDLNYLSTTLKLVYLQ